MAQILLDVDGPCCEFVKSLLWFMSQDSSLGEIPPQSAVVEWDFFKTIFTKEQKKASFKLLEDPEVWKAMTVVPGSQDMVAAFRTCGHEVTFITSPWIDCVGWETARRAWLKKHFSTHHDDIVICPSDKKYRFYGDFIIDDKIETVRAWQNKHPDGNAHLFDCTHNTKEEWHNRVHWEGERGTKILEHINGYVEK